MKKLLWQVVGLLVFLGMGLGLAQIKSTVLLADEPAKDPLVARSYVEEALSSRLAELESQVAALKTRVQELERKAGR